MKRYCIVKCRNKSELGLKYYMIYFDTTPEREILHLQTKFDVVDVVEYGKKVI